MGRPKQVPHSSTLFGWVAPKLAGTIHLETERHLALMGAPCLPSFGKRGIPLEEQNLSLRV